VIKSEPTNTQLSLITHPPTAAAADSFASQLSQRLTEALRSASVDTPAGKGAPAQAS
jgi:hypothetical protein